MVKGTVEEVYAATREADFLEAWRRSAVVRVLFAVRSFAEGLTALVRRQPSVAVAEPERLRLLDLQTHGDWVLLGERPPSEIAFGVVGRFWSGETVWEQIDADQFVDFDSPGRARIACSFSLRPHGSGQTLVSYECRTQGTDRASTAGFLRYWRLLSPFIGVVLRAQLRTIADTAAQLRS